MYEKRCCNFSTCYYSVSFRFYMFNSFTLLKSKIYVSNICLTMMIYV